jgi:adenosylhomocysteine nucleosidase
LSATGVVAALAFEARSLGTRQRAAAGLASLTDGSLVSVCGMGGENAARAARQLIAAGAGALLSWGVAGGLDPELTCGTVVLPVEVVHGSEVLPASSARRFATCRTWRERLGAALQAHARLTAGALLSSPVPVAAAGLKARLFQETRAVAVDMESAAVAEVAADHGLPFVALRVILDTARDSLPESILRAFAPAALGSSRARRAWPLLRLLRHAPADFGPLLRLAGQYRIARRTLSDCARRAEPTRLMARAGGG